MDKKRAKLTTAGISALRAAYTQNIAMICIYKRSCSTSGNPEIKSNLEEALSLAASFTETSKRYLPKKTFQSRKASVMRMSI
ncbi:hypothetical protein DFO73_13014 [Cytobacillus oceanisediminis]|uniref:Uncharacterized protein n=1 Tax=Cytobacillus oceanisediminis TaxID=665099 RepID=A0A2V2ZB35_9BACI|nr:hypothetical protein [Cytobacillus oceanisediminis]PWW17169.1 hypothetical protein DFO73_13014 [Cytobacillus oceanisediminis]